MWRAAVGVRLEPDGVCEHLLGPVKVHSPRVGMGRDVDPRALQVGAMPTDPADHDRASGDNAEEADGR